MTKRFELSLSASGVGTLAAREFVVLGEAARVPTHIEDYSEISGRLGISTKTVENHKHRIFAKLGVHNQAHAVSIAVRTGLIDHGNQWAAGG